MTSKKAVDISNSNVTGKKDVKNHLEVFIEVFIKV